MSIEVGPSSGLAGDITVPGDKSISHRAVMFGALAEGTTHIAGLLEGEDNNSTLDAFIAMGVDVDWPCTGSLEIEGRGLKGLAEPADVINAGNSGTTARLLTGILAAQPFFSVITGDESLRRRPMKRVVEPLSLMGANIIGRKDGTLLPLAISGGRLVGIDYKTSVASAQLKTCILLAGLNAEGTTTVREPAKSRDHTERMLSAFGADIRVDGNTVSVGSTKALKGCNINVPADISSAAFFMVAASITAESDLRIRNVGVNPTRTGIVDILRRMGASIELLDERMESGEPVADIRVRSARLKGLEITGPELLPAIDEFPVICVAAAFADGVSRITGASELRVKESDRIAAAAELLADIGVKAVELEDGIEITGTGGADAPGGADIESHGDHRMAMSAAVAALRCTRPVIVEGAEVIDVSFPGFFQMLDSVRKG